MRTMSTIVGAPNGGELAVGTLRELGVQTLFSVSGNQILPLFDAAPAAGLRIVHMRHESAAAYAAAAEAELLGGLGAVAVSAGPAFLAALTGVSVARSYELPLLFCSGHTATHGIGAGGFQDLDQEPIARVVCKASIVVRDAAHIGAELHRAARIATDGIPGPVHVALPGDTLLATAEPLQPASTPGVHALAPAAHATLNDIAQALREAARPLIVARPAASRGRAGQALSSIASALGIAPVIVECPRGSQDLKYRTVAERYPECDIALVVGPADFTVGFLGKDAIAREGIVALIDAPDEPGPRRAPQYHVRTADLIAVLETLATALAGNTMKTDAQWRLAFAPRSIEGIDDRDRDGHVHPLAVASAVRALVPGDVPIALDGGEFCQWMRLGLAAAPNRVMWNSRFGAIGGSVAEAVGMSVARGGPALAISGDGALGYHPFEFETAVREHAPVIAIVGNDARWAAEWHMQIERHGAQAGYGTMLTPAAYANAMGGLGALAFEVSTSAGLRDALERALAANAPACINVMTNSVRSPAVAP